MRVEGSIWVSPVGVSAVLGARVYIVDNDPALRDSVKVLLDIYGYEVHGFASGEEFVLGFDGQPGGCLVLDVSTRGMTGIELARLLLERGAGIPVIMISGRIEHVSNAGRVAEGVVDFLAKPFSDTAFVEAIERALAGAAKPLA